MSVVAVSWSLLAAVTAASPSTANGPIGPSTFRRIETYFKDQVERARFPGGSLAIVQGDHIVLLSAVGVSDLDTGTPVTPETVFCIGSLTKSFTATALLQLRDQGLVDLDAPVTRYLPWFRVADEGAAERITLRHLLTHTSGLPTNSHSVVWQNEPAIRNSLDLGVRALAHVWLRHPPGEQFEYANMNYVVLGRVVEQVSGVPWDRYVEEHIFAPAGMTHSAIHEDAVDPKRLARPYGPEFGRLAEEPLQAGDFIAPASNILSTAPDLARYAAAHLGTGALLLRPATLNEAHSAGFEKAPGVRYAFGWINERFQDVTVVHHGGAAGHAADIYLAPQRQLAVVTLFGAYSKSINDRIAEGVLSLALGREPPPIEGPRELSQLLWIERSVLGVAAACPATAAILPLARRRRRREWRHRYLIARAVALVAAAVALWVVRFVVVPHNVPELPLPFGVHGWTMDLVVVTVVMLMTATLWALWGVAVVFLRARSIAAISAARRESMG
jgi:CubicO group peptidase (beta-lactamase class C family)